MTMSHGEKHRGILRHTQNSADRFAFAIEDVAARLKEIATTV